MENELAKIIENIANILRNKNTFLTYFETELEGKNKRGMFI